MDLNSGSCSIVVPCFNEGKEVLVALETARRYVAERDGFELIVVDDGSTDGSSAHLREFSVSNHTWVRLIAHPVNRGLTAAMVSGAQAASYDTVAFLDADLSYAPETVGRLLEAQRIAGATVAVASPYMAGGANANVPLSRLAASKIANWLLSLCLGGRLHTFTGMVRTYDKRAFLQLSRDPPAGEFNAAMIAGVLARGGGVVEIPAELVWPAHRSKGPSRLGVRTLLSRVRLVIETCAVLFGAGKGCVKQPKNGSLVLVSRPNGHFSLE